MGGYACEGGAFAATEVPADGVLHAMPGPAVEGGDVVDQTVGGAGTVEGDQRVSPVGGRDLHDGRVEHLDVIGRGVGTGAAGAQQKR